MKNNKNRRPPTAVLVAIIAVIVAVSSAVAWLTVSDAFLYRDLSLSNFDAYANVYFEGEAPIVKNIGEPINVDVDTTTKTAPNYIGKLRVDAEFKGQGSAYIRLKVIQQWQDEDGTILQSNALLPYNISTPYDPVVAGNQSKWYDNRKDDYCLYYATKLKINNIGSYLSIPIISTGFIDSQLAAVAPKGVGPVTLKIAFTLEAVQINRYPQFWGIDTLPWPPVPVSTTAG